MNKFRIVQEQHHNHEYCTILTMLEGDSDWGVYKSFEMCNTVRYPIAGESFVHNSIVIDIQDLLLKGYVLVKEATL